METIWYSIICEDSAHRFFLNRMLGFDYAGVTFQFNEACFKQYFRQNTNREKVKNTYVDVANQAFRRYEQDLNVLFVMIDYDDETTSHKEYCQSMSDAVFSAIRDKVVIAIPVQSIEHWMRYLQWKGHNPNSTKNVTMETENRTQSKIEVYGTKKPHQEKIENTVNSLLKAEDINWLVSRSESFRHFHGQVAKIAESNKK